MNLIKNKWIPVKRVDGSTDTIAPWEIGAAENPVSDIAAPRPDFRGALYQFLIGLVQTAFAPEDDDEWEEKWNRIPECEELKEAFEKFSDAFELDPESGPAFMQDFNIPQSANDENIASVLIDAPGENTLKLNKDLFVKRQQMDGLCQECFASALLTLQINASSGGAGHRTSLRGGGPLSTIVLPGLKNQNIWALIWSNIISGEYGFIVPTEISATVFPWMGPTKDSEPPEETKEEKAERLRLNKILPKKELDKIKRERENAKLIYPEHVDILQQFWSTPRRIRLKGKYTDGICGCCNRNKTVYKNYLNKNYGANYSDTWQHVLSPYYYTKNDDNTFSLNAFKGREGGYSYRDWLALTIGNEDNERAALVVKNFNENKYFRINKNIEQVRIWCFGYDMDKDKTRCWYEHLLPLFYIKKNKQDEFIEQADKLIAAANETVKVLISNIKSAWFTKPKDVKGNTSFIANDFWSETESSFYSTADKIHTALEEEQSLSSILSVWRTFIISSAEKIFDRYALNSNDEPRNMKRIAIAARNLSVELNSKKKKAIYTLKEAV